MKFQIFFCFIVNIWQSCTSFEKYRDFIQDRVSHSVYYMLSVFILSASLQVCFLGYESLKSIKEIYLALNNHYQHFELSNGQLKTDPPESDFVRSDGINYKLMITPNQNKAQIDSKYLVYIQMLKSHVIFKIPEREYKIKYSDKINFILNKNLLSFYKKALIFLILPLSFLVILIFLILNKGFQIIIMGLILRTISLINKWGFKDKEIWVLSVYAMTPVIIFSLIAHVFQISHLPMIKWVYYGIHLAFGWGVLKTLQNNNVIIQEEL